MWIYLKLAWRNLFRNKRRSFIAGIAIGIGLASLIFVDALMIGMEENMVKSATSSFLGEGQIHREGFRETQDVALTINHLDDIVSNLKQEPVVSHFTRRVMTFGMITSPANVNAISLVGIDPSTEQYLSQVDEAITDGAYFTDGGERDIVIGSKLAETLEAGIGGRVVVTVAQVADPAKGGTHAGDLSQEMFRISGIYHFNIQEMDGAMAFIRLEKAQAMLALGSDVHEIAIKFVDTKYGRNENLPFWKKYSRDGNVASGWTKILPQLEAAFELSQFSIFITGLILFGVVALGIINTLFMSLHERMFEFGVLRAVGTRPFGIARLIILEAGALAILSIALGNILGFAVTYLIAKTGIDYTGIEFAGVTFRELLYPVMNVKQFVFYPFWVFVFTSVVGIYPSVYAAKMSPAAAMRKSL
ncbi:ABC transporter permease [candidate division KSB1 bacterium]|nr:ABC transporter permease [candidate division KSB1 bacterium]